MLLEALYGKAAEGLPRDEDAEQCVLTAATVARPPSVVVTDSMRIFASWHQIFNSATFDMLKVQADPATFRQLGLLCLGVLLHQDVPGVDLRVAAPDSDVRLVRIRLDRDKPSGAVDRDGLLSFPVGLRYGYSRRHSLPLAGGAEPIAEAPDDKPFIQLSNAEGFSIPGSTERRDHMTGFGGDRALAKIASLLMDLGAPQEHTSFYLMEDQLAPYSAELALGLPATDWSSI